MIKVVENKQYNPFTNSTNTSYYDDLISDKPVGKSNYTVREYYRFEKGVESTIEYMTANEYIDRCTHDIFRSKDAGQGVRDSVNVDKYAKDMLNGDKFPLPYLNYSEDNRSQEGRHRMLAAAKAFGEDTEFPVLIVRDTVATDEEILDYANKKYPQNPEWVVDMVNAILNKKSDNGSDEDEDNYEIITGLDISRHDIIDFGDGWCEVFDYDLLKDGLEVHGVLLDNDEDVEYIINDNDEVKLRKE